MPYTITISIIAIAVAVVAVGAVVALRARQTAAPSEHAKPGGRTAGGAAKNEKDQDEKDAQEVERIKRVVHNLLEGLSESIESLLGDSTKYGSALDAHKANLKKAETIEGLHDLEQVMLAELSEMQAANSRYRSELDEAKAKATNQQEELERLQTDVGIDYLTGIPNRRVFAERLDEEMERTKRYGSKFSLIIMDLDHFKEVNDKHGHLAGDRILRAVAKLLQRQKRKTDFLARFGGEEFALILPETPQARAWVLAEKMRRKVEKSLFRYEDNPIHITISMGVGQVLSEGDTPEQFFERVDEVLYRAKHLGRNRIEVVAETAAESG